MEGLDGTETSTIWADGRAFFASTVVGNSSNAGVVGGDFRGNSDGTGAAAVQARQFAANGQNFQGRNALGDPTFMSLKAVPYKLAYSRHWI